MAFGSLWGIPPLRCVVHLAVFFCLLGGGGAAVPKSPSRSPSPSIRPSPSSSPLPEAKSPSRSPSPSPSSSPLPEGLQLLGAGYTRSGQLGLGTASILSKPELIPVPNVWSGTVTAVVAGSVYSAMIAGGAPYAAGSGSSGKLGVNSTSQQSLFVPMTPAWPAGVPVTAIAAGIGGEYVQTLVVAGGDAYAVGRNSAGQLGDGTKTDRWLFVKMTTAWGSDVDVTAVSAGTSHSLALAGGSVYGVGSNSRGQLGQAASRLTVLTLTLITAVWPTTVTATAISAGGYHTVALAGNVLYITGKDLFSSSKNSFLFVTLTTPWAAATPITAFASGSTHMVVLAGNELYGGGDNSNGQLGTLNRTGLEFAPMAPAWDSSTEVVAAIATGKYHTAVVVGGAPYTVGKNTYNQLGDGTTTSRTMFVPMTATWDVTSPVVAIAVGDYHTLVVAVPGPSPSPSASRSPTPSPVQSPSMSASRSLRPSASPVPSPSWSVSLSPSPEGSPSPSPSPLPAALSPAPSASPPASPNPSDSPSPLPAAVSGPASPSASPSLSPAATVPPAASALASPSASPSPSPAATVPPAASATASPSASLSESPAVSPAASAPASPSASPSISPAASVPASPSTSPSASPAVSPAASASASPTTSPSHSPAATVSPAASALASPSASPSKSPAATVPPAASPLATPSAYPSPSPPASAGPSPSPSPSPTEFVDLLSRFKNRSAATVLSLTAEERRLIATTINTTVRLVGYVCNTSVVASVQQCEQAVPSEVTAGTDAIPEAHVNCWGTGVEKAIVSKCPPTVSAVRSLGLTPPASLQSASVLQVLVVDRSDTAGNLVNDQPVSLMVPVASPTGIVTVMVYSGGDTVGVDLTSIGGSVVIVSGGYLITSPHSSTFVTFETNFTSPSFSPASPTTSNSSWWSDNIWWVGLAVGLGAGFILLTLALLAVLLFRRSRGTTTFEGHGVQNVRRYHPRHTGPFPTVPPTPMPRAYAYGPAAPHKPAFSPLVPLPSPMVHLV
eukprot:EG_transcript_1116